MSLSSDALLFDLGGGGDAPSLDQCPCLHTDGTTFSADAANAAFHSIRSRLLQDDDEDAPVWQTVTVAVTLFIMFVFMLKDWIGPDWVMVSGLTLFMACEIVTVKQGLEGFSNEGVLTVMSLFVVAESVSRTGALDHYMGMVMGKPKTVAGAQIRLMVPIAIVSAFLNNTPIVAVMIPLTLRWAKSIGVPPSQLLIPLSYATILGGTCSLVGTSTNLVVSGLLDRDYPNEAAGRIGLLDISIYGVPNALIGMAYILAFASTILPNGGGKTSTELDDLLLGARVTPWSPAAGRTVKRSGLGNSGGIYLVNVRRGTTGNVHRAVSKDFVISVGDELFFTGLVEEFSAFTEKHGLEIITTENATGKGYDEAVDSTSQPYLAEIGATKESTFRSDETERMRVVNRLSDQVHGTEPYEADSRATRVIVTTDAFHSDKLLIVGVDTADRQGLLMDISKILLENGLQLRHSEAKVIDDRSLSIWRCESGKSLPDVEELWSSLHELLQSSERAALAAKRTGIQVVRAVITKSSRLIGKKAIEVKFRDTYKAALIAFQKDGKNASLQDPFSAGDLLVLETYEDSPLVTKPPKDFYGKSSKATFDTAEEEDVEDDAYIKAAWNDLKVMLDDEQDLQRGGQGEFLTAFVVAPHSPLANKSTAELGFSKLSGVVLVQIERPAVGLEVRSFSEESVNGMDATRNAVSVDDPLEVGDILWFTGSAQSIGDLKKMHGLVLYEEDHIKKATPLLQDRRLVQAVIARGSPLAGYTVKEARFRSKYDGAVIAIQRGSDRIHDHPARVKLQTGDVLLIEAGPSFMFKQGDNYKTFALLGEVEDSAPPRPRLFLLCVVLVIASLAVAALEYRALIITATLVGIIMVATGVVTQEEARNAIQWDLFVVVAAAFGVGKAMENSGVANGLAKFLVRIGSSLGIGGKSSILASDPSHNYIMYISNHRFSARRRRSIWGCVFGI